MLISVAAAILFIANIFRKGWVFPIIAVGLWGFISIVVGTIYPAVIQRFVVQPNEYASRPTSSATSTRRVPRSGSTRSRRSRSRTTPISSRRPSGNRATSADARQRTGIRPPWNVLAATEEFRPFYAFSDVDVDRYKVDALNEKRKRSAACVSSTPRNCRSNTWTNRHLVYTHGYGIDTAQANATTATSARRTCPPTSREVGRAAITQPDVYFGEGLGGYSVVDSKVAEQEANGESAGRTGRSTHGSRRREGHGTSLAGSLRAAAVRRLQPRVLGPGHDEVAHSLPA